MGGHIEGRIARFSPLRRDPFAVELNIKHLVRIAFFYRN